MSGSQKNAEDQRVKIIAQTAELSRLLGMVPSDDSIPFYDPAAKSSMVLSDWLDAARDSFLSLSALISNALDIQLQ